MVLTSILTRLTRKYFLILLVLSKTPSASKDHYLTTNLLLLLILLYILFSLYIFSQGNFNLKHCLLPITSFLVCLFINLTFYLVNIRFCQGESIYPCNTSTEAYWLRWVLGDVVSCKVLINVFYVSLIGIGLNHVTYLYRKKIWDISNK